MKPLARRLGALEAAKPHPFPEYEHLTNNEVTARIIEVYMKLVGIRDATEGRAAQLRAVRDYVLAAPEDVPWQPVCSGKSLAAMTAEEVHQNVEASINAVLQIDIGREP
jgi:hypothetical protein